MTNVIYQQHRKLRRNEITAQQWWDFIALQSQNEVRDVVNQSIKAERRLQNYKMSFQFRTRIRKYANELLYTDIQAYEVVRVISAQCVEIRRLDATCVKAPSEFTPGGFFGHYSDNHAQKWEFTSNPNNPVKRLRLGKKGWGMGKFRMNDQPHEFYDYNF